ncbi:ATP-binding cassette domain-containing protein [Nesterenkonia populi]|uniref:ATP-binding cassette domain-containing protein n=1 Tax=Nesterenkonia populi TaxID=1591087 RepID=UPI0011BF5AD2|nr:ABC transporter ATP-binding protein [Nesterenkonia populi]
MTALKEKPAAAAAETGPVASLKDVRISLERNGVRSPILRGIDLEVGRGEIVGVVGESGSGKSVMSMSMLNLLPESSRPQTEGGIRVSGHDMASISPRDLRDLRRRRIGVVFQDPMTSLNPTMHVGTQITEKSGSAEESIRLMEAVGIPEPRRRYKSYPHELSGGQRQRAMIAMAVAGDPELIIADEPTTALDVTVQAQVLALLKQMQERLGCSILMITHDLGVAGQIADRIVVMNAGEIVEQGPSRQVLTAPQDDYTKRLLSARLSLDVPGPPPAPGRDLEGEPLIAADDIECTFTVRDEKGRRTPLRALRGVTLYVQPGESIAVVGESGSGKSTMLRAVGRLQKKIDSGRITGPTSPEVQMVFQDAGSSLTPWLTVEEMLSERFDAGVSRAERSERIASIIERVGLPLSVLRAKAGELSGGQRQRVVLARATIVPPKVLLCDEPTSALDVSVAAEVLALINQLRTDLSIAVVFVTHDLAVARMVSDRIAVMHRGRVVELGPADDIIDDARHPYTRQLLAAVPDPRRRPGEAAAADEGAGPPEGHTFERPEGAGDGPLPKDQEANLIALSTAVPRVLRHSVACFKEEGTDR